jgi:hypothetical protein
MAIMHVPLVELLSDSDGMDSSTRALNARCAWAPVTMPYHAWHYMSSLPKASAPVEPIRCQSPPGEAFGCLGPSWVEERGGTG